MCSLNKDCLSVWESGPANESLRSTVCACIRFYDCFFIFYLHIHMCLQLFYHVSGGHLLTMMFVLQFMLGPAALLFGLTDVNVRSFVDRARW